MEAQLVVDWLVVMLFQAADHFMCWTHNLDLPPTYNIHDIYLFSTNSHENRYHAYRLFTLISKLIILAIIRIIYIKQNIEPSKNFEGKLPRLIIFNHTELPSPA